MRAKLLEDAGPPHSYMSSALKPRCARGTNCYHVRKLRSEKPATVAHEGDLCEKCQKAEYTLEGRSGPNKRKTPDKTTQDHRDEGPARQFKNGLVLDLWMEDGPFWESVRDVRTRWGIEARTRPVPSEPKVGGLMFPESAPRIASKEFRPFLNRWMEDLAAIRDEHVPAQYQDTADWNAFISACILCEPPEENLLKFARHGDLRMPYDALPDNGQPPSADKVPLMAMAQIKRLADESDLEEVHFWLFACILDEIRRDPSVLQLSTQEILEKAFQTNSNLRLEYFKRLRGLPRRWYIEVPLGITKKQVGNAYDKIVGPHKPHNEGGALKRDPLVALQCAILYDRHNVSVEGKSRRWTHSRLAEALGLPSAYSVKMHLKDGREILKKL